ncbi:hypothetical protein EON73_05585 [bacterium]|nr:MAG: hypothetical protein EON73_05585 [bacterium]
MKNPSSRLTRIRLELEEYKFDIVHIPGKDNVVADALSRIHIDDAKNMYEYDILAITRSMAQKAQQKQLDLSSNVHDSHFNDQKSPKIMVEIQSGLKPRVISAKLLQLSTNRTGKISQISVGVFKNHKKLFDCKLIKQKSNETVSLRDLISKLNAMAKAYQIAKIQWPLYDKIFEYCDLNEFKNACAEILTDLEITLIKRPPFIESKEAQQKILELFHTDKLMGGHCGQKRLYAKLRTQYYWPKMTFDLVQIDTIEPTRKSNNNFQYAITIVDELSKYLVLIPITDKSAKTVARAIFEKFILLYGTMKGIKTDLGTEYVNDVIDELSKLLNITHLKSTAYHHETVGGVERSHRILNEYIRAYLNGNLDDWDAFASYFCFCYNTTPNTSTNFTYSPFELIHGFKANLPTTFMSGKIDPIYNIDNVVSEMKYRLQRAHLETREIINKIKIRNKNYFDKKTNIIDFKAGDKIKILNEPYNKFKYIYSGPFNVLEVEKENVIIDLNGKKYKIHKNRIAKY